MSPEQALGLAGRRRTQRRVLARLRAVRDGSPASGRSRARRRSPIVSRERSERRRRRTRTALQHAVSRDLAAVVLRAMAPSRDERFRTAGDLALALDERHARRKRRGIGVARRDRSRRRRGDRRGGVRACGTRRRRRSTRISSPSRHSTSRRRRSLLWKEGLVDVMSRSLDGAGALRAVPASVVVHRWRGRADAQSARAFGEATGARLVVYGGLLAAGDSVRATVSLLDVKTGRTIAEIEQRDVGGAHGSAVRLARRSPCCASSDARGGSTWRTRRRRRRPRSPRSRRICTASSSIARRSGIRRRRTSSERSRSIRRSRSRIIGSPPFGGGAMRMIRPDSRRTS